MRPLCLLVFCLLSACAATPPPPARHFGPALWKIEANGGRVYLFGTVHLLITPVPWLTPTIQTAFANSRELWVETDLENHAAIRQAVEARANDAAYDLPAHLAASDWTMLIALLRACNVTPERAAHLRPWAVNTMLASCGLRHQARANGAGAPPANATPDVYLVSTARASGMPVHGFETPDQQIAALADVPDAVQIVMLHRAMQAAAGTAPAPTRAPLLTLADLVRSWMSGDLDALSREIEALGRDGGPDMLRSVYTLRNERFADDIAILLGSRTAAFVAIGTGHFVGAQNVLAQLRTRGFIVTRVE